MDRHVEWVVVWKFGERTEPIGAGQGRGTDSGRQRLERGSIRRDGVMQMMVLTRVGTGVRTGCRH